MIKFKIAIKGQQRTKAKIKALNKLKNGPTSVLVGVPKEGLPYPDGTRLVDVAATNEFGLPEAGIPERSFLRSTVINKRKLFLKFWSDVHARKVLTGEETPSQVLDLLGQIGQAEVQRTIVDLKEPPNSPRTIAKKGSSNPLVDTGHLRQSIRYQVDE